MQIITVNKRQVFIDDDVDLGLFKLQMHNCGYVQAVMYLGKEKNRILRRVYYLHRFIMGLEKGDRRDVDHINFNKLDNRRENLRVCTRAQNLHNNRGKGVSWTGSKWYAYGRLNGKMKNLGLYDLESDAVAVANDYKTLHRGAFANLYVCETRNGGENGQNI